MTVPTIARANTIAPTYSQTVSQNGADAIVTLTADATFGVSREHNALVVRSQADGRVEAHIYGTDGQRIESLSASLANGRALMQLPHLRSGVYVAVVTDAHGHRAVIKFVVSNKG